MFAPRSLTTKWFKTSRRESVFRLTFVSSSSVKSSPWPTSKEDSNSPASPSSSSSSSLPTSPSAGFGSTTSLNSEQKRAIDISLSMARMIKAFRTRGHFAARIDPLQNIDEESLDDDLKNIRETRTLWYDLPYIPDVVKLLRINDHPDLSAFGMEDVDLDECFYLGSQLRVKNQEFWSLRQLISNLSHAYSGNVGIEYAHLEHGDEIFWLETKIEGELGPRQWGTPGKEERLQNLECLQKTHETAQFLGKMFPGSKVFGIDGCEALCTGLKSILRQGSEMGVDSIEMGMAHRGRINVLNSVFEKKLSSICNQFNENEHNISDVKYHLGTRAEVNVEYNGKIGKMRLSLAANPSHLEAVNSVVLGTTKAAQFYAGDMTLRTCDVEKRMEQTKRIMPVLIHGDASFCGQGIVAECLELSNHPDYTVGGCIHIIVNNQIGFTTNGRENRYSYQCTNVAKSIEVPIFHVNGDDIDAVNEVCKLAVEWRMKFGKDVVIDLVCYRRQGHNTLDDPRITQPVTYRLIDKLRPVFYIYRDKLLKENLITQEEINERSKKILEQNQKGFLESKQYQPDPAEWLASNWQGKAIGSLVADRPYNQTGLGLKVIEKVGRSLCKVPEDMVLHPDIEKLLNYRTKCLNTGEGINMAFAEALAFGCLMKKFEVDEEDNEFKKGGKYNVDHPPVNVRLSGQDSIRGTFNQRHAKIVCQKTSKTFWQLNNMDVKEQATISVCNSALSEAAVLGFEYGYSLSNEMALTIWEAQFGDFANVAQSIIDNFIVSGENKWANNSALVMLLPHGYDGQGPEHSSARLERFLQMADDDPNEIPGKDLYSQEEMESGWTQLVEAAYSHHTSSQSISNSDKDSGLEEGWLDIKLVSRVVAKYAPNVTTERIDIAISEILSEQRGIAGDENESVDHLIYYGKVPDDHGRVRNKLTRAAYFELMASWLQRNYDQTQNIIVIAPTTPAQYFHALRRQIHRHYAKPLVVMSSKWLLHHKSCTSDMADMGPGTFFQRVILEEGRGDNMSTRRTKTNLKFVEPSSMKKIIFCSGKIFYHLYHARSAHRSKNKIIEDCDTIMCRIEQIAPFPYDLVAPILMRYPNAQIVWVQEEPKNMGAWGFVQPRFDTLLKHVNSPDLSSSFKDPSISTKSWSMKKRRNKATTTISYIGRAPSASPATGSYKVHAQEQEELLERVFVPVQRDH